MPIKMMILMIVLYCNTDCLRWNLEEIILSDYVWMVRQLTKYDATIDLVHIVMPNEHEPLIFWLKLSGKTYVGGLIN